MTTLTSEKFEQKLKEFEGKTVWHISDHEFKLIEGKVETYYKTHVQFTDQKGRNLINSWYNILAFTPNGDEWFTLGVESSELGEVLLDIASQDVKFD